MKELTAKEAAFVREYLIDLNATQAAIRAQYSAKTAGNIAEQVIKRPHVAAAIQKAMNERAERTGITADMVLQNIARIATKAEHAKDFGAALKGNELLGKHLKLFTERHEHTGKDGGPIDHRHAKDLTDDELAAIATGSGAGTANPP